MASGARARTIEVGAVVARSMGSRRNGEERSAFALTTSSRSTHEAAFAIVASVPSVPTFAMSVAFVKRTPDAGAARPTRGGGVDWRYATVPAERNDASVTVSCSALIQSPDAMPSKTRSSSMSP